MEQGDRKSMQDVSAVNMGGVTTRISQSKVDICRKVGKFGQRFGLRCGTLPGRGLFYKMTRPFSNNVCFCMCVFFLLFLYICSFVFSLQGMWSIKNSGNDVTESFQATVVRRLAIQISLNSLISFSRDSNGRCHANNVCCLKYT